MCQTKQLCSSLGAACEWAARLGAGLAALSAEHPNAQLAERFCMSDCRDFLFTKFFRWCMIDSAFAARDHETMAACYADDAVFRDAAFGTLDATHARAMWRMFCVRSADLAVRGSQFAGNDRFAVAHW